MLCGLQFRLNFKVEAQLKSCTGKETGDGEQRMKYFATKHISYTEGLIFAVPEIMVMKYLLHWQEHKG